MHDKAWVPAGQLQPGDWILTAAGDWKKVEEAWNTGEIETVYNLTVADWHTYFVGDDGWGWAAWAHNQYDFISALKVVKLARDINPSSSMLRDRGDELARYIEKAGRTGPGPLAKSEYGPVGDHTDLSIRITRAISSAKAGNVYSDATKAVDDYFKQDGVLIAANQRQKEVNAVSNWTTYIQNKLADNDARGKSLNQARQEYKGNRSLHGHHIVYKKGSITQTEDSLIAKDILLYYGINPFFARENLAYEPNPGGHSGVDLNNLKESLKAAFAEQKNKSKIVEILLITANEWFDSKL